MRVVSCLEVAFGFGLLLASIGGCERTLEEACGALAGAECEHLTLCSTEILAASYGDVGACERAVSEACARAPSLPGAGVGPDDIDACAAAYPDHPCDSLVTGAPPRACRFRGEATNGTGCEVGAQCQSSFCSVPAGAADGRCAALRDLDEACSKGGSPCAPGLYCAESGRCVPLGTEGDACSEIAPCNPLHWCKQGVCEPPASAPGDLCAPCAGGPTCDLLAGLVCAGGTCEPADDAALVAPSGGPACE